MLMPDGNMILHPTGACLQISSTDMYITVWMVLTIIQLCLLIASSISSIQKQASPIAGMDGMAISATHWLARNLTAMILKQALYHNPKRKPYMILKLQLRRDQRDGMQELLFTICYTGINWYSLVRS